MNGLKNLPKYPKYPAYSNEMFPNHRTSTYQSNFHLAVELFVSKSLSNVNTIRQLAGGLYPSKRLLVHGKVLHLVTYTKIPSIKYCMILQPDKCPVCWYIAKFHLSIAYINCCDQHSPTKHR